MRLTDRLRIALLVAATGVACCWPALNAWAQTQDYINGTTTQQIAALGIRIDKIESMINAVLLAMVINFVTQIVQIRRNPIGRNR